MSLQSAGAMCTDAERYSLMSEAFRRHFAGAPTFLARAPGRVDLMGSHTDYNLGHVLTMAISRDIWITGRARADSAVQIYSMELDEEQSFDVRSLTRGNRSGWGDYVRGVAAVLAGEHLALRGFDAVIHSTVPMGSGLSSSAALECAVATVFQVLGGWRIEPGRMARLCQRAEHEWAMVKCGILDQYTSCCGETDSVLVLDCRTVSHRCWKISAGLEVFICDTRSKRELVASEYGSRRAQCEEGARRLGAGALCDVNLESLMKRQGAMPAEVFRRCRFIIEEDARVLPMARALSSGDEKQIANLSAASFHGACDLYEIGSPSMDAMMNAMMNAPGVVGARQAGAGFGGCMVAIIRREQDEAFAEGTRRRYFAETGIEADVYAVRATSGAGVINHFTKTEMPEAA